MLLELEIIQMPEIKHQVSLHSSLQESRFMMCCWWQWRCFQRWRCICKYFFLFYWNAVGGEGDAERDQDQCQWQKTEAKGLVSFSGIHPVAWHFFWGWMVLDYSSFRLIAWVCWATTWIGCKFGHQMAPLALITNLATRWRYLHQ